MTLLVVLVLLAGFALSLALFCTFLMAATVGSDVCEDLRGVTPSTGLDS
jgi:hypothetical protein